MPILKTFLVLICLTTSVVCHAASVPAAETKDYLFREGNYATFAPPVINKDYFLIEYGFVVQKQIKKWDYFYNAYASGVLFEDWIDRADNLKAGALGFKGGAIFPAWKFAPLFLKFGLGYAKTTVQKNPVLGKAEQSVSRKDMALIEVGILYRFNHLFLATTYQQSSVRAFKRHLFFSVGVNY